MALFLAYGFLQLRDPIAVDFLASERHDIYQLGVTRAIFSSIFLYCGASVAEMCESKLDLESFRRHQDLTRMPQRGRITFVVERSAVQLTFKRV